jgi:4-hydroxy-4-methyl-2-oxoglutarate aldolase
MKKETVGILPSDKIKVWDVQRVDDKIIQGFKEMTDVAGVVARALDQFGINGTVPASTLPSLTPGKRVVGSALTVRSIPERKIPYKYWEKGEPTLLGEREAFFLAREGDVVVIDGSSVYPASNLGSFSVLLAARLGVAGVIVDGMVTGVDGIRAVDIPIWSKGGTTVTGHHRLETAEINGPIGMCGIRVEPGDLVIGDDSGVTVVPREMAADVLARCHKMKGVVGPMRDMVRSGADRETLRRELAGQMQALSETPVRK